jgi:serine protease
MPASKKRPRKEAKAPQHIRPRIVIKFRDEVNLPYEKGAERVVKDLGLAPWHKIADAAPGATLEPVFVAVPEARLRALVQTARQRTSSFRPRNFFSFFALTATPGSDLQAVLRELKSWAIVEHAYIDRGPSTPPAVNAGDDPRSPYQGYLSAAPIGIDAHYAWLWSGGDGEDQSFVDLEYGWLFEHEDLAAHDIALISGENTSFVQFHGTSVLGIVCGVDNTVGGVGITPHLESIRVVSEMRDGGIFSTADAVLDASAVMGPGDVLLIESQYPDEGPDNLGFLPRDTQDDVFAAVSLATALGIVVVEAAGNGGNDLDSYSHPVYGNIFDPASGDFRDSGAIMVGAGTSLTPHARIDSSNYGGRIDCYAWGENIDSATSYADGVTDNYDPSFGGTSGAAAIIAGAALAVQGIGHSSGLFMMSPGQMRALFRNPDLGTPSADPESDRIGPMPNLEAILNAHFHTQPDVYIRDFPGDDGDPHDGAISASPDIILRQTEVENPVAEFGAGSPGEDSITLGSTALEGQDNFIYVRVLNRSGFAPTFDVTATVYWSPPATLVSPYLWELVGSVVIPTVPGSDELTVSAPITWPANSIPESGHYCFVGLVGNAQDPAPDPVEFEDFDTYRLYIRNNNNVTWRNFNVDSNQPDEGDFKSMKFIAPGANDRTRRFCLEVLAKLPRGSRLEIEAPLALLQAMQAVTPWTVVTGDVGRVPINPHGRHRLGCAYFPPKHAFPFKLLAHIPEAFRVHRYDVAVRQLYEGEEVGRVTWRLMPAALA